MPPVKTQHRRTAVGCWTCRRRRIKCDAQRPSCLKCQKSKLNCEGYDIKLNWSSVLAVNGEGECFELTDLMKKDNSSAFQRSNIELCKWWLYDFYNDLENDLDKIDHGESSKCGPFRSLKLKSFKPIKSESSGSPYSYLTKQSINTIITKTDILKDVEYISAFLQREDFAPNLDISRDVKLSLADYLLENNEHFDSQLNFIYLLCVIIIQLMYLDTTKENVRNIWNYYNKVDSYLVKYYKELIDLINNKFDESFFNKFIMTLNLKIIINTNLGIYQDWILSKKFKKVDRSYKNSMIFKYYKFFQATNQLINSSSYVMSSKYKNYYIDLTPDYNLLKYLSFKPHSNLPDDNKKIQQLNKNKLFDYESRRIPSTNKHFKVKISVYDTPDDQIIRIPKYKEDEENKDEQIPPSFVVEFDNNIVDDTNNNDRDNNDEEDDDDSDNESYDSDETEDKQYDNLFSEFNELGDTEESVYGISAKLIYLYEELTHLINHRIIFNKIEQVSRNWMRIISDFEDLLTRQIPRNLKFEQDSKNDVFHNFLIFCFFKYVKNYPLKFLSSSLDKIIKNDLNIGIIKFVTHNVLNIKDESNIYGNNYTSKTFLKKMNNDDFNKFNIWDSKGEEFYVI